MPKDTITVAQLAAMIAAGYKDAPGRFGLDVYVKRRNRKSAEEITIGAAFACHYQLEGSRRVLVKSWKVQP